MKKVISLFCSILLTFSLCVPAFAADLPAEELKRITLEVKKLLTIGNDFTEFNGTPSDMGAMRYWELDWSNDDGSSISATVTNVGKVMQYHMQSASQNRNQFDRYAPSFSKTSPTQAQQAAAAFLKKVMVGNESGKMLPQPDTTAPGADYSFSAEILLNGIPSANTAQIQVDASSGNVSFYQRDDLYSAYVNALPTAIPAINQSKATQILKGAVTLDLQYVSDGEGTAVLQYIPSNHSDLYVDAQSGTLTDLNEAWKNVQYGMYPSGSTPESAVADKNSLTLSEAETAAIAQIQGVLSKEALDAILQKNSRLGLDRYTLRGAEYMVNTEEESVLCRLRYVHPLTYQDLKDVDRSDYKEGLYQQVKILSVDAKTGELLEGWCSSPWCMKPIAGDPKKMQAAAQDFLAAWKGENFKQTKLSHSEDGSFSYVRHVNGYDYQPNNIRVEIDPADYSVQSFSICWDNDLKFESAEGVIPDTAAKTAYGKAWKPRLEYIAYPVCVDTSIPIWKTYAECCGGVAYRYVLGYTYEFGDKTILGVNAKTGKLIHPEDSASPAAYLDIAASYAKTQIETLARNGIRFSQETKFHPTKKLTQAEMLVLLLNSCGWNFDTLELDDEETLQDLYETAWNMNFLPNGEKDPESAVSRLNLMKAIISASPYGKAAQLQNIFRTSFSDAAQIPKKDLGYAAIAQGLGLIHGNSKRQFFPNRTATRQDAAAILYNYMNR